MESALAKTSGELHSLFDFMILGSQLRVEKVLDDIL